ncbi:MAG TPA: hypothetical protein VME70_11875 [Mycobacteriales bacterium]|nr:hypothetical protein [Mycobacteriales bacterium]
MPSVANARPAAASFDGASFDPPTQTLTSTTHKKLRVNFFASIDQNGLGSGFSQAAGFTITRKGVPETHDWTFPMKKAFTFSTKTDKGSIKTKSQLSPYATVNLTFAPNGKKHTSTCGKYKTIRVPVKVKGSLTFDTRSGKHGWGKVHASHLSGKTVIYYETGDQTTCNPGGFTLECGSGISWNASHSIGTTDGDVAFSGSIDTVKGKTVKTFYASRTTTLSKPKGSTRGDTTYVTKSNSTLTIDKANDATLVVKGTGPVTGSVTMASPAAGSASPPQACGKGKHEVFTNWQVTYTNGKSPLAVHEQIEGTYKLPNMGTSDYTNDIDKTVVS